MSSSSHLSPRITTPGTPGHKGKKRVGFSVGGDAESPSGGDRTPVSQDASRNSSYSEVPPARLAPDENDPRDPVDGLELTRSLNEIRIDSTPTVLTRTPRPERDSVTLRPVLRLPEDSHETQAEALDLARINDQDAKKTAARNAYARATDLERDVASAPASRTGSPSRSRSRFFKRKNKSRENSESPPQSRSESRSRPKLQSYDSGSRIWDSLWNKPGIATGQNTPDAEELEEYFPEPARYRAAGLSAHLMTQWWNSSSLSESTSRASSIAPDSTPSSPGTMTPLEGTPPTTPPRSRAGNWSPFSRSSKRNNYGIANLVSATSSSVALGGEEVSAEYRKQANKRPKPDRKHSHTSFANMLKGKSKSSREFDIKIKKHIRETQIRKRYILKLCRALMEYGAPTHRLEGYLTMSARVLEIDAQFLYIPGTMIISFDDAPTHTTEMKLVRVSQGVDLSRMKDTHNVYKDVSYDIIGVEEGIKRLENISKKRSGHPRWLRLLAFGIGSAAVGPFAFGARFIDVPICFLCGLILGFIQLVIAPKSDLYAAIFEVVATGITSFLARYFGSIHSSNGTSYVFCFSAIAQSSIALILPGFTVLSAALELQSRQIVAGSVRIVYAVIYSLWLGYGLTIGTTIYGAIDKRASSDATCSSPLTQGYSLEVGFVCVPIFTICLAVINNAKWWQMPAMVVIALAGYEVNYFASRQFPGNIQVVNTLGACAVALLANLYSRLDRRMIAIRTRVKLLVRAIIHPKRLLAKYKQKAMESKNQRQKGVVTNTVSESLPAIIASKLSALSKEKEKDLEAAEPSTQAPPDIQVANKEQPGSATHGPDADSGVTSETATIVGEEETASGENTVVDDSSNSPPLQPGDFTPDGRVISRDGKAKKISYGLAAASMLPAIFVQVPSGVSVAGSLVAGIAAANNLTNSSEGSDFGSGIASAADITSGYFGSDVSFTVAASVVQVAIGITIGLFIGNIMAYPTGKGSKFGNGRKSRTGLSAF